MSTTATTTGQDTPQRPSEGTQSTSLADVLGALYGAYTSPNPVTQKNARTMVSRIAHSTTHNREALVAEFVGLCGNVNDIARRIYSNEDMTFGFVNATYVWARVTYSTGANANKRGTSWAAAVGASLPNSSRKRFFTIIGTPNRALSTLVGLIVSLSDQAKPKFDVTSLTFDLSTISRNPFHKWEATWQKDFQSATMRSATSDHSSTNNSSRK